MGRAAVVERNTAETSIRLELRLDGAGSFAGGTGVGFFDHMLAQLAKHALFDLSLTCRGDLEVDAHHTVEDAGICLGLSLRQALADASGIRRFGSAFAPMDEALVLACIDLSGRPGAFLQWHTPAAKVGSFDTALVPEFLRAFASTATATLHVRSLAGENAHHVCEATFKALGLALREAVAIDPRRDGVPSTKGALFAQ
jgi:imidazoleglycerol-phosphate dehydratase